MTAHPPIAAQPRPTIWHLSSSYNGQVLIVPTAGAYRLVQALVAEGFAPLPASEGWHGTHAYFATLRCPEGVGATIITHRVDPLAWPDEAYPRDGNVMQAILDAPLGVRWLDVLPQVGAHYRIEVHQ